MRHPAALAAVAVLALAGCGRHTASDMPAAPAAPASAPDAAADEEPMDPQSWLGDFNVVGNEPFWALDIRPAELRLFRPETPTVVRANPGPRVNGKSATWETDGLSATLTEEACSDGMSDQDYPWSAVVTVGDETLKGCAMRPGSDLAAN